MGLKSLCPRFRTQARKPGKIGYFERLISSKESQVVMLNAQTIKSTGAKAPTGDSSEILRFGGSGTFLLISLLALVGLHPFFLGGTTARIAGGIILATIFVSGTIAASRSLVHRAVSGALAILALAFQTAWLTTSNVIVGSWMMAALGAFSLYTGFLILRRVLSFGPLYADRVHAALSVYILLALFWAAIYSILELNAPGSFSIPGVADKGSPAHPDLNVLAQLFHFSMATLTSTGYGDIIAVAPFARSFSQVEQLMGVFYIAVLISRLVGLYPESDKGN